MFVGSGARSSESAMPDPGGKQIAEVRLEYVNSVLVQLRLIHQAPRLVGDRVRYRARPPDCAEGQVGGRVTAMAAAAVTLDGASK